jgi:dipeptidyl aminopeptidase/acylaminoacyl peptidase
MRKLFLLFLLLPCAAAARPITETDLLRFHWLADPQISPDGRSVAYVEVSVNEKKDAYETSLWLVSTTGGKPRQLTSNPHDSAPRWSPDSLTLAFNRGGQLYLLPMHGGGEARELTSLPRGVGSAVWSPNGRTLAFTSDARPNEKANEKPKSDVRVITRAVFRSNGSGYEEVGRRIHLWTVPVGGTPRQLTSGPYSQSQLGWSHDGTHLQFVSNPTDEPYYEQDQSKLYSVLATGGTPVLTLDPKGALEHPTLSPDGKRLAFIGGLNPDQSYFENSLCVATNGKTVNLTRAGVELGSEVLGDQSPPRGGGSGSSLFWTPDGRAIFVATTVAGRSNLVRVDATTGKIEPITTGNHCVNAYTVTPNGGKIALTLSDPTHVGDLYVWAHGQLRQLTHVNDALMHDVELTEPEEFHVKSFDGRSIDGWVQKPPTFDPTHKYPVILQIHGGPHGAYGYTFTHEFQWMAARGYVVVYLNPRGSTSYSQEFANVIQYHYPGDDYKDCMAGVDEVLRRGYADPDRLGITGGSGGGLLTNWAVTQTGRFKAAVSQRSIADWAAWWYSADFTLFRPEWFRQYPWQDPEDYRKRSPVTYVANITTPMMFVDGDNDLRCPPGAGGEAMFRALKALHKTAVMVRFPGENHNLSRNGKPRHRVERLQHILAWFDKYLLGKDIKTYDLD